MHKILFLLVLLNSSSGHGASSNLTCALQQKTLSNYDSSLAYCSKALNEALSPTELIQLYELQLYIYQRNANVKELYRVTSKVLRLASKYHKHDWAVNAYLYLANISLQTPNITEAQRYLTICTKNNIYRKALKQPKLLMRYYLCLIQIESILGNTKKNGLYLALCLNAAQQARDTVKTAFFLETKALYNLENNSNLAWCYIVKAQKTAQLVNDSGLNCGINASYARILAIKFNENTRAIDIMKQSLLYSKRHRLLQEEIDSYLNLATLYATIKNYDNAILYFDKAISTKGIDILTKESCYSDKYKITLQQHNYKYATVCQDSFYTCKQLVNAEEQLFQLKTNETQQQQQQQQQLKEFAQQQQLTRSKYIGLITALLLVLILTIVLLFYRKQYANQKLQHATLHQQLLRSQMNPHFMFNSLNALHYYILDNEKNKAAKYLSKLATLVRNSLNQSFNEKISLADETRHLTQYMELECYRYADKNFYEINSDDSLDTERVKIPHMLLQPFVENAFNHGLKHKTDNGKVTLTIAPHTANALACTITDDGLGRNAVQQFNSLRNHNSKALTIITERMALLNKFEKPSVPYSYTITDLYTTNNQPAGTAVTLIIPYD